MAALGSMMRPALPLLVLALVPEACVGMGFVAYRPDPGTWKKTQCGGPTGGAEIPSRWAAEVGPERRPLAAYPRPQMVRGSSANLATARDTGDPSSWVNLNGLWEWERGTSAVPRFGRPLAGSILVPFPVESCLSGVAPQRSADIVKEMWYRLTFDLDQWSGRTLLHFGAVDWSADVYLNEQHVGDHLGGFDGFSFDITPHLREKGNELLVHVFDPSDDGVQPNGKQRISAIDKPMGDTYTPSSGIWQTVWLERVPTEYIRGVKIDQASTSAVTVAVDVAGGPPGGTPVPVTVTVTSARDRGQQVTRASGWADERGITVQVPSPQLWSPESPHLYDLQVSAAGDSVLSYFGLRTFVLGNTSGGVRPLLNGRYTFMAGFLDQSWWPDGQYTAPTDEALEYDLVAAKMFGLNMVRLHQKVNPERWYYFADKLGVAIFQDVPQKYGNAKNGTVPFFVEDMKSMIMGRGNHPCILQWETFNEGDCYEVFKTPPFDIKGITDLAKKLDPTRLVDTDSGGGANDLHLADVNDIHSYPYPGDPKPLPTQYAMVGEFGGLGAFIKGKEWVPGRCFAYLNASSPADGADKYISMAKTLLSRVDHVSASVYTQTTDVELECDGFLNYDRSNKFTDDQTKAIYAANQAIIKASQQLFQERGAENGPGASLII